MATDENWQTKLPSLVQRTTFIFANELLSDVKFVVPLSSGERESTKVIPAHKFVLAISSPVFFAMFYGQMAENKDSIELPDCDYEGLVEFFRFLYSDEVTLSGSNVMQVMYLANKYLVPSLAEKCKKYLCNNLTTASVFSVLRYAQKFEDKDLEDRCWEVIEKHTEEAVTSDEFVTVERFVVESVVKRERLMVKEVELFKAVDLWATKEGERQGITPDGEMKRRLLGEEIVKGIRFPLMSMKEFVAVVYDTAILSWKETGDMMKYYADVLTNPLPFLLGAREKFSGSRVERFSNYCKPSESWNYDRGLPDIVHFSVNKPIKLLGIQHFGSPGGEYTVSTEVNDVILKRTFTSEKDENNDYYGFNVLFDDPVRLDANKQYTLVSLINGPVSWCGKDGQASVKAEEVTFTFCEPAGNRGNSTSVTLGQFPAFIFI